MYKSINNNFIKVFALSLILVLLIAGCSDKEDVGDEKRGG